MTTDGFESLAGLRKQIIGKLDHLHAPHLCNLVCGLCNHYSLISLSDMIIVNSENCYFFNPTSGDISLIITHEPIGTYKAIVLSEIRHRRDVLLSSDSSETVLKAFEHLLVKSTDAVQQYITANEFRRLPPIVDDDDDDAVSSVSSYADESDKNPLADSSLSLESELESAYESPSEDGTVSHSRAKTGGRSRSFDVRTVRRDSRSRSHSRSRSRSSDRTTTYRKAPVPPARFPVHRNRAVDPPRPYTTLTGIDDLGNVRISTFPPQMPPVPGTGFMAHPGDPRGSSDPHFTDLRKHGASLDVHEQRLSAMQQRREEIQRAFQEGQRMAFGTIDLDGKPSLPSGVTLPSRVGQPLQPGPWQQPFKGNDSRPYMAPPTTARSQAVPPPGPLPPYKIPMKKTLDPGKPSPPPMIPSSYTSSIASSSGPSTPTITGSPKNRPPEYSSATPPASIDYKLVIKTRAHSLDDARGETSEHRILARTPPTRKDMSILALRYIHQSQPLLRHMNNKGPLRALVTRVVFNAGQAHEEKYDLAAYPESDFSRLCDIMKRTADDGELTGLPLFEVDVNAVASEM